MSDAIVVGARPNGLIAANLLADHGWSVLVLEEQDEPGGAVKSGELTVAGHVHDLFSAFYPFAAASQVIGGLDLEEHGLRWAHAESVVAHPREDGRCAVLSRDLDRTAASLDAYAPGNGDAWRRLFKIWYRSLIDSEHLPDGLLVDLGRFQYDNSTIKVDWALREPIPWTADAARGAGTVHVAEGINELASTSEQLVSRLIPARPSLIMGQYATADPGRSPEGADTAWAYTHVPQQVRGDAGGNLTGTWDEREIEQFADRVEERVERLAPGFRGRSLGATYSVRASSRQRTRTSSGERSTAGRRKLTSSWSSARHPGISDGRRLQSAVSILRPPRRIPAAACMVAPERTRRGPRSRTGAPVAQPSVSAASPRRRRCDGSRVEVWLRRPEGI